MMKGYILTITLNPAIDKTVTVPNFRLGKDFREKKLSLSAGGKGINVSRVLRRLGAKTIASGFLGGRDGQYIKKHLKRERIRHSFSMIRANSRTSLTILDPYSPRITRILERGPKVGSQELATFRRRFSSLLRQCWCVVFSGRSTPGVPDSLYAELIVRAKKKKIITVFDTSGSPLHMGMKEKPFMIKPNIKEAESLCGKPLGSISQIKQATRIFHRRGIPLVIITMGSQGAVGFNGEELLWGIPPKLKRRSPVGCGDAFIAGFIACWSSKQQFAESFKMGIVCGAANALSINPGFIKKKDITALYKNVVVRTLKK